MKASVRSAYGPPSVLRVQEVDKPMAKDHEVLVRVYATTVNRSDYHVLTGKPFIMRFFTGLLKPRLAITGSDFAGHIEATGKNVTRFKVGDKVMGFVDMGLQSHAEYLTVAESKVTRAPANLTCEQVPACLEGAFYALCGVRKLKLQAGHQALVIGATGAIGSSYVQLLKYHGVVVTAVCGKENDDLVRSLGATQTIDYKTEDFTKDTGCYDVVIDAVGKYGFGQCKHLLKEQGMFTSSQPNLWDVIVTALQGGKKVVFPMPGNLMENLAALRDLAEHGDFKPVIDRKYSLEQIAAAYEYVAKGEKIGNVMITVHT